MLTTKRQKPIMTKAKQAKKTNAAQEPKAKGLLLGHVSLIIYFFENISK